MEGMFSFQYVVAAALLDGQVGINTFTDERCARSDMVELLEKTSLASDPGRSRDTRSMRVDVEVTLEDGTTYSDTCTRAPGFWGSPVDADLHRRKIRDCLSVRFDDPKISRVVELLDNLEHLQPQETGQLMELLA
jgi:2-methylcitrate dehydratase PrpD